MNRLQLIGNVGREPQPFGEKAVRFSVAANESYKNKAEEWKEKITWVEVIYSGNKSISKGQRVYVEGRLDISEYEGKIYTRCICSSLELIERPKQAQAPSNDFPTLG